MNTEKQTTEQQTWRRAMADLFLALVRRHGETRRRVERLEAASGDIRARLARLESEGRR